MNGKLSFVLISVLNNEINNLKSLDGHCCIIKPTGKVLITIVAPCSSRFIVSGHLVC